MTLTFSIVSAALPAWLVGLMTSWVLETLLQPRPVAPWRRPLAAVGVHAGIWTLAFALELMLFRRPWFGAVNVLMLQAIFIIVNNAKYRALREPFVYPDFIFFSDALKHPRLYLPFLGWKAPLAAALGYGLALWAGLTFEPPIDGAVPTWVVYLHATTLAMVGWLWARGAARRLPASARFDAQHDLKQLGLWASLCQYARAEREDTGALRDAAPFAHLPDIPGTGQASTQALPDLIVVQSESFFDPRRHYPQVRPDVLANYDLLRREALQHGPLRVPAWGANTIRTEFAFLTGLAPQALGVHRFHPYRKLAGQGVATLASYLRRQGYRTLCVHPYHAAFYDRDTVLPALGFDAFIDLQQFGDAPRNGPYVSDVALADYLKDLLQAPSDQPLYVHVITMENHGPLHWERVTERDAQAVLNGPMPPGCEDLVAYLRHLGNADLMLGRLRSLLLARARAGVLCWFGDHVPIMQKVYAQLGPPDSATDYLLWRSDCQRMAGSNETPLSVEHLAMISLVFGIRRDAA